MYLVNNPNIGLYGFCTDSYCLLGPDISEKDAEHIGLELQVPVHRLRIAGTSLLGVFLAGNEKGIIVPEIAFPEELKVLDKIGISYTVIQTKQTCLGNNTIISDAAALVSKDLSKSAVGAIEKALQVKARQEKLIDIITIGSLAVLSKKGMLVSHDLTDEDIALLQTLFDTDITTGTMSFGNPYVKSCVLVNSKGIIASHHSGGPELVNAERAFGFAK